MARAALGRGRNAVYERGFTTLPLRGDYFRDRRCVNLLDHQRQHSSLNNARSTPLRARHQTTLLRAAAF